MKKLLSLLLVLFMMLSAISINADSQKLSVIATTFPSYELTKNLLTGLENEVDLQLLQDKGVDLHNYQPTAQDFMKLAKANMLIYVGGPSDNWVSKAMEQAENKDMKLLSLVDAIEGSAKQEAMVEGMQEAPHAHSHDDHDHEHADHDHHDHEHADHKHDEHEHKHEHKEGSCESVSLNEWKGSWNSYLGYFEDAQITEALKKKAEKNNTTVEQLKEKSEKQMHTDFLGMKMDGDKLVLLDKFESNDGKAISEATYKFVKVHMVKFGKHDVEWHEFKAEGEAKYPVLLLTDVHGHGEGSLSHFHLRYGSDVDELLKNENWWPTFVASSVTAENILASLSHGEEKHDDHHDHEHADHKHDEHEHHDHEGHSHTHVDEHVWLSIKNSIKIVEKIAASLIELRPELKEKILANKDSFVKELSSLDKKYEDELSKIENKTVIIADRFPFLYLMEDYGIKFYAAFQGCAAEAEASFETIKFLAEKADEIKAKTLFVLEGSNKNIAEAVNKASSNAAREITVLNSIQTISMEEINAGASFLKIMEANLEALLKALK